MDGEDVLSSVVALEDPLGVLSIYAALAPEEETHPRPAWELELRRGLDEARACLEAEQGAAPAAAFDDRLEELGDDLDLLVSPRESGRGRALFAGLSGSEAIRISLQQPFPPRVVVAGCALARPLASALEAGRPAGLLLVSEEELRVWEWRLGRVEELRSIPVLEPGDRRQLLGPSAAHPRSSPQAGSGFHVGQQRDLYERRAEEGRMRFLAHAAHVPELARERGWDEVVLGGDESLAGGILEHLQERDGVEAVLEPRLLGWLAPAALAAAITPMIEEERARRQLALLERVRDEALAGGQGAIGLADTLAALAEGRVELLLLPADRDLRGSRALDGSLYPPEVAPPGISPADLRPEPFLAERMVQRAVRTDARVTFLRGGVEAALGTDDAAALLRW